MIEDIDELLTPRTPQEKVAVANQKAVQGMFKDIEERAHCMGYAELARRLQVDEAEAFNAATGAVDLTLTDMEVLLIALGLTLDIRLHPYRESTEEA